MLLASSKLVNIKNELFFICIQILSETKEINIQYLSRDRFSLITRLIREELKTLILTFHFRNILQIANFMSHINKLLEKNQLSHELLAENLKFEVPI